MSGIRYRNLNNVRNVFTGAALTATPDATIGTFSNCTITADGRTITIVSSGVANNSVSPPLTAEAEQVGTVLPTGNNVFLDKVINIGDGTVADIGGSGGFTMNTNGTHAYYINCTFYINVGGRQDFNLSPTIFTTGGDGGLNTRVNRGFRVGSNSGRPPALTTSEATSRGHHFFGCTFNIRTALRTGHETEIPRINGAYATIEDTNFIVENPTRFYLYLSENPNYAPINANGTHPSGMVTARFRNFIFDNDRNAPQCLFNFLSNNVTIELPTFIGAVPQLTSGGNFRGELTGYSNPNPGLDTGNNPRFFNIGSPTSTGGILLFDSVTRVPSGSEGSAVFYNGPGTRPARVVEITTYDPEFYNSFTQVANNGLSNFKVISTTNTTFNTVGNPYTLSATAGTNRTDSYETGSDGKLPSTSSLYNPRNGGANFTSDDGLQYPTLVMTGGNNPSGNSSVSDFLAFNPNVRYRSLFQFVNSTGEVQVNAGTNPIQNFQTQATGLPISEVTVYNNNSNLRTALLSVQPTNGGTTVTDATTIRNNYNNNVTADVTANGFRAQNSYEFNNLDWYDLLAGANYYTAPNGVLSGAVNITTNATTNDFTGDVSITGSLVGPLSTDVVTSFNSTGTLDWGDSAQNFNGAFSTNTNLPSDSTFTLLADRTSPHYTGLATTSTFPVEVTGSDDVYFVLNHTDGSSITITKTGSGSGNVIVLTTTSVDRGIGTDITLGTGVLAEPAPITQPTRVDVTIPANAIGLEYTLFRGATGSVEVEDGTLAADTLRFTDDSSSTPETTVGTTTGFRPLTSITDTFVVVITGTAITPTLFSFTPANNTALNDADPIINSGSGFIISTLPSEASVVDQSAATISAASTASVSASGTLNANRIPFEVDGTPTTASVSENVMNYLFAHSRSEAKFRTALRKKFPEAITGQETRDVMQLLGQNAVNLRNGDYVMSDADDTGVQACAGVYDATGANFDNANPGSLQSLTQDGTGDPQVISFPRQIGVNRSDLDSSNADQTTTNRAYLEQIYDIVKDTNRTRFRSPSSQNDNLQD